MLKLIEMLKFSGKIKFRQDFLDVIDMPKQNFRKVLQGEHHFTVNHIERACKEYKVNVNWLFGFEKKTFREPVIIKEKNN